MSATDTITLVAGDTWDAFGPFGHVWVYDENGTLYEWPEGTTAQMVILDQQGNAVLLLDSEGDDDAMLVINGTQISMLVTPAGNAEVLAGKYLYTLAVVVPGGKRYVLAKREPLIVLEDDLA